jgi:hypothetical protein
VVYVRITETGIRVIGHEVDHDVSNFTAEEPWAYTIDDLPDWLDPYPVQTLLPLTMESEVARAFCLAPRVLPKDLRFRRLSWGISDSETVFRAAFLHSPATKHDRGLPPAKFCRWGSIHYR